MTVVIFALTSPVLSNAPICSQIGPLDSESHRTEWTPEQKATLYLLRRYLGMSL